MVEIFTTSGAVIRKMGANASSAITQSDAFILQMVEEAESYVNVLTRYNFSDNYAGLNDDVKKLLSETVENLAAIYGIMYDMSGFTSRIEAEDMINVLWARFQMCVDLLRDQKSVTYIGGA